MSTLLFISDDEGVCELVVPALFAFIKGNPDQAGG